MNKMGFGFLRLTRLDPEDPASIDYVLVSRMADRFLAAGGTYFDTAYTYLNGNSELALRECVVKRHPRENFRIADKLPPWKVHQPGDLRRIFDESKARCGVDYFDVYLLHAMSQDLYMRCEKFDMFGFLCRLKESGEAKEIGFSYHDSPELLDLILTEHPEVDYVQLQINYLDWRSPSLQAEKLYETALRHGKKIVVMEPVKGGSLVRIPEGIASRLPVIHSPAFWALRFVQSLSGIETVLSGMNAMEQMDENMQDLPPLTPAENEMMLSVAEELRATIAIPCTGCGYCTENCPRSIAIPQYFALYNEYARDRRELWKMQHSYDDLAQRYGKPADCILCRQCERSCPQHIEITSWLAECAVAFSREMDKSIHRVRNTPGIRAK